VTVGLLAGLLRPRAAAPAPPPDADHWYDLADEGPTAAGVCVTPDSALRVASVFACVRLLGNTIGSLPMFVYERLERGKRKAAEHPLYGVLHGRPNEWQTPFEFRQMMQSHLCLRGNAYARIVPGVRGAVDQLIPLHPDRVDVFRIDGGRLGYMVGRFDSPARERLTQDEVFHLRGFSSARRPRSASATCTRSPRRSRKHSCASTGS
jgi:HK97 family phage portal protein